MPSQAELAGLPQTSGRKTQLLFAHCARHFWPGYVMNLVALSRRGDCSEYEGQIHGSNLSVQRHWSKKLLDAGRPDKLQPKNEDGRVASSGTNIPEEAGVGAAPYSLHRSRFLWPNPHPRTLATFWRPPWVVFASVRQVGAAGEIFVMDFRGAAIIIGTRED